MKNDQQEFYPAALTIAGSDSGGGAGIQADLRTFNAAGVYGCSVITAVTAQEPRKVTMWEPVSSKLVKAQYEAVTSAIAVRVIKTGMLANAGIIEVLSQCLSCKKVPLVVDPVMISTSGASLLDKAGLQVMKEKFLMLADMITPNLPEAEYLLDRKLRNEEEYIDGAVELARQYKCNILLKTGHAPAAGKISDIAVLNNKTYLLTSPRLNELGEFTSHGTGCTLSSAIAAMLAIGNNWQDALKAAKAYVFGSLNESAPIGKGIEAMYPPLEDYSSYVTLRAAGKNSPNTKGNAHA